MQRLTKPLIIVGIALGVGALVLAAGGVRATRPDPEARNADLLPAPSALRLTRGQREVAASAGWRSRPPVP